MDIAILIITVLNLVLLLAGGVYVTAAAHKAKRTQAQLIAGLQAVRSKRAASTLLEQDRTGV